MFNFTPLQTLAALLVLIWVLSQILLQPLGRVWGQDLFFLWLACIVFGAWFIYAPSDDLDDD